MGVNLLPCCYSLKYSLTGKSTNQSLQPPSHCELELADVWFLCFLHAIKARANNLSIEPNRMFTFAR